MYNDSAIRPQKESCRTLFATSSRKHDNYFGLSGANLTDIKESIKLGSLSLASHIVSCERESKVHTTAVKEAKSIGLRDCYILRSNILGCIWPQEEHVSNQYKENHGPYIRMNRRFSLFNPDFCGPLNHDFVVWLGHVLKYGIEDHSRMGITLNCVPRNITRSEIQESIKRGNKDDVLRAFTSGRLPNAKNFPSWNYEAPDSVNMVALSSTFELLAIVDASGLKVSVEDITIYRDTNAWMMFILLDFKGRKTLTSNHVAGSRSLHTRALNNYNRHKTIELKLSEIYCRMKKESTEQLFLEKGN